MQAVVLDEFGSADALRLGTFTDPVASRGWTTVRLKAAALNWHDVLVRQGRYDSPLPHVIGADGAGVDEATGEDVLILPSLSWGGREAAPAPGWEILGDSRPGTYAERVAVPRECVFAKPRGLSWAEAAAVPLVGCTAYRALFSRARLQAREKLLVLGAGGGVATTAVALAAAVGAQVYVTSSDDEKIARAVELGASGGVRYDGEHSTTWPHDARALTPEGFDVVLDAVGVWADALSTLRPGGRLAVLGSKQAEAAMLDVRGFYFGQFSVLGTTMGSPRDFRGLLDLMDTHPVPPPVIDRVYALDHAVEAHRRLESGAAFGKLVLEI